MRRQRRILLTLALVALTTTVAGCAHLPFMGNQPLPAPSENPMFVPGNDPDFCWNQITDTVDDYFRIEREERPHVTPEKLTEGYLRTYPQIGASLLQPNKKDSVDAYQRLESTLQTIRRRCEVRVIPWESGGYMIEVIVHKEMEDLSQPEQSTVGGSVIRHDGTIVRPIDRERYAGPVTLGWIPLGRDTALEQQMLREMRGRLLIQGGPVRLPPLGP